MNEAKEGQKEQTQATTAKGDKPPSNRMVFMGLVAVVILINAIVAIVLVHNTISKMNPAKASEEKRDSLHSADQAKHANEEEGGAVIEKPITAVVNIAGTDGTRFLRAEVKFGYDDKKYKKFAEEFEKVFTPKIKDILIDMLSQIPLEELQKPDTKDEIRRDLKRMVNEVIPKKDGQVTVVYINDFIIQ
jgi:flagellar basal body-associated protein FliL